jgi:hypothetical protein
LALGPSGRTLRWHGEALTEREKREREKKEIEGEQR